MALAECPICGFKKLVADEHVGRMTKCPKCAQEIRVQADAPEVSSIAYQPSTAVAPDYGPTLRKIQKDVGLIASVFRIIIVLNLLVAVAGILWAIAHPKGF